MDVERTKRPSEVARFLRRFPTEERHDVTNALLILGLHSYLHIGTGLAELDSLKDVVRRVKRTSMLQNEPIHHHHRDDVNESRSTNVSNAGTPEKKRHHSRPCEEPRGGPQQQHETTRARSPRYESPTKSHIQKSSLQQQQYHRRKAEAFFCSFDNNARDEEPHYSKPIQRKKDRPSSMLSRPPPPAASSNPSSSRKHTTLPSAASRSSSEHYQHRQQYHQQYQEYYKRTPSAMREQEAVRRFLQRERAKLQQQQQHQQESDPDLEQGNNHANVSEGTQTTKKGQEDNHNADAAYGSRISHANISEQPEEGGAQKTKKLRREEDTTNGSTYGSRISRQRVDVPVGTAAARTGINSSRNRQQQHFRDEDIEAVESTSSSAKRRKPINDEHHQSSSTPTSADKMLFTRHPPPAQLNDSAGEPGEELRVELDRLRQNNDNDASQAAKKERELSLQSSPGGDHFYDQEAQIIAAKNLGRLALDQVFGVADVSVDRTPVGLIEMVISSRTESSTASPAPQHTDSSPGSKHVSAPTTSLRVRPSQGPRSTFKESPRSPDMVEGAGASVCTQMYIDSPNQRAPVGPGSEGGYSAPPSAVQSNVGIGGIGTAAITPEMVAELQSLVRRTNGAKLSDEEIERQQPGITQRPKFADLYRGMLINYHMGV